MNIHHHPSQLIDPASVLLLKDNALAAEQLKQLHATQLAVVYQQKWFQLFVPKIYNGLELSLVEGLRLEEAIAWADGSTGWTVALCSGAGWFIGFLNSRIADSIFNDDRACLAGSGKPSGVAKVIHDGYEITGYWNYATGAAHATVLTCNCIIEQDGIFLKNEDGTPFIRSFILMREEVIVHKTWKSMGMIATGSNSFEVKGLKVNNDRAFQIDSRSAVLPDPIYQYPFLQFAETTLAVNSSGMAIRFLELCASLFEENKNTAQQSILTEAWKKLDDTRHDFFRVVQDSWNACLEDDCITSSSLQQVSGISRKLALLSRLVTEELYPFCGLRAANPETEINRIWRNMHTASQHRLLNSYTESV
jgi:hypothetical protein